MANSKAVILFGHGARAPEWARPMERVQAKIQTVKPDLKVELAFLEFMSPTLPEAIDALVLAGADHVSVVPMFLAQGGHLKKDLPVLLDAARAAHPGCSIELGQTVGEVDTVIDAMAAHAAASVGEN